MRPIYLPINEAVMFKEHVVEHAACIKDVVNLVLAMLATTQRRHLQNAKAVLQHSQSAFHVLPD
jgi:hypothetical protein